MIKHLRIFATMLLLAVFSGVWAEDYELYSGDLTEGDYVIVYDGCAMKNTVSSSRLDYNSVEITNNKISAPNASYVWHIAPNGEYWTIYNASVNKYAASTGAKNKAQLLDDGTNDMSLWSVTSIASEITPITYTYEFVNKQNTTNKVNANLRKNSTYGFACYATATGGALSLYKKVESSKTVATITLTEESTTIDKGNTYQISATTNSDATIAYTSSDATIVTVSSSGLITGVAVGSTTITVSVPETDNYLSASATFAVTVTNPVASEVTPPYTETLLGDFGNFTTDGAQVAETDIWTADATYGAKASARVNNTNYEATSWLYTPTLDLTSVAGTAVVTFEHVGRYFGTPSNEATLWVVEKDGTSVSEQVNIPTYFSNSNWTFVESGNIDLQSYVGHKVKLGFKYVSSTANCGTWEIKNFNINAQKASAGLAWSEDAATATMGLEFAAPTLTNTHNVDVTYSSSDENVATIDANGAVTIVAAGGTTITATFAGNDNYEAAAVSYTLTVNKQDVTMAFSETSVTANIGETITVPTLTTNPSGLPVTYKSQDKNVATVNSSTGEVTLVAAGSTVITATFAGNELYNENSTTYTLIVKDPNILQATFDFTNNTYGLQDEEYLEEGGSITESPVTLTASAGNVWRYWDADPGMRFYGKNGSITFSVPSGYLITEIVFAGETATGIKYEGEGITDKTWSSTDGKSSVSFTSTSTTQKLSTITVTYKSTAPTYTSKTLSLVAELTEGDYYATFSNSAVTFFPNDVTVSQVAVVDGQLLVEELVSETVSINNADVTGCFVPANTGVLVNAIETSATYYTVENKTVDELTDNYLVASVEGGTFEAATGYVYYKLAYNDYDNKTGLGFYWGAANGGAFSVKAGTAYLAVPSSSSTAKGYTLDGESTGISSISTTVDENAPIYNLSGQRVNKSYKGVVIQNGKKYFVK